MTSLALFPQLRRTLTDVMEDELYHVPGGISNSTNQTSIQQQDVQNNQFPATSFLMQNHHLNNSNHSLNNKFSPTLAHTKLFRNASALNSEEMLTIPEQPQPQQQQQQQQQLSRIPSHDMYYDVPEPLIEEDKHIFNEFADPNLTTTNHFYRSEQQHNYPSNNTTHDHPQAPAKLLKFNDDLSLDYFTNEDDSKFVIYPVMSPTMIPEEIEDEEISDDDDYDNDDDNEFTYLDNTINDAQNPLNYQHQRFQAEQEQYQSQQIRLINEQESQKIQTQTHPQQQKQQQTNQDDLTQEIESDIDRMSLDSSDDEYSSNSSVIEDDTYTPTFKSPSLTKEQPSSKPRQRRSSNQQSSTLTNAAIPITSNNNNNNNTTTTISSSSPNSAHNSHQCHLINPSTNGPCLKQFSRPYDLIRHQETIHASRKKIFRCVVCNKLEGGLSNKTFSRGDALSRHIRVKHGLTGNEATDALQYAKDHVEYV